MSSGLLDSNLRMLAHHIEQELDDASFGKTAKKVVDILIESAIKRAT
jgi:hypothetical protein